MDSRMRITPASDLGRHERVKTYSSLWAALSKIIHRAEKVGA